MYGLELGGVWSLTGYCARLLVRLAVFAALGAALALGGCGRKGPLDPPPSAAISPAPPANQPTLGETEDPNMTGFRRPPPAATVVQPAPSPAPADKRTFILDPLIK
jgi:predicted small lipoprotein YifL